jgi:hypothetical protein
MTIGEGMQPGCMMKILEAERWLESANLHKVALLKQQQEESRTGAPCWRLVLKCYELRTRQHRKC